MSSSKRSGARDISELKARLGLKKTGPAAKPSGVAPPPGIVPPPGTKLGGNVPAPPGTAQHQHQAPIPDATQDPFAAMSAMAQQAQPAVATAPVVFVDDGKPVAKVEKKGKLRYLIYAGAVLGILIFGMLIGKVGANGAHYNASIDDAVKVRDDVIKVGKAVIDVQQTLQVGKERGNKGGQPWFALNDEKLTKALKELPPLQADSDMVYKSNLYELPAEVTEGILRFYQETGNLNKMIKEHVAAAERDSKAIVEGMKKTGQAMAKRLQFGAILTVPKPEAVGKGGPNGLVSFRVVQLGQPICQGANEPTPQCPGVVQGWQFRTGESENWRVRDVKGELGGDKQLLLLDPSTPFYTELVAGGKATVAIESYMKRLEEIDTLVQALVEQHVYLKGVLNNKSREGRKFTFGM